MPSFGASSLKELSTCEDQLQEVFQKVMELTQLDFTIVQGARTIEQARENFKKGTSQVDPDKGQFSKHMVGHYSVEYEGKIYTLDRQKSLAVDICPYQNGLKWNDAPSFYVLAGMVLSVAKQMGVNIRYGGGWDLYKGVNHLNTINQFMDIGHFELVDTTKNMGGDSR